MSNFQEKIDESRGISPDSGSGGKSHELGIESTDRAPYDNVNNLRDPDEGCTDEERAELDRKLLRKLDLRLIPWLCLLYLLSFLDRTNIGNAKIEGLVPDLHMTPGQYNAALSLFFVSYSIFEPASNVLLKRLRPKIWFPVIMIAWGICMTCMGLVKGYSGLLATRWFLGFAEAGLFPGVNYYLSCWYKRNELGLRASVFFSAAAIAGSFGGLLAAAISKMDGVGGKPGWAWIFILEGLATVLVGLASFFVLVDFPDEAKFLTDDERLRVLRRLQGDKQSSAHHENFSMKYIWQALTDWKTYIGCLMYMGVDGPLYAFSLFLPTIIKELHYTSTKAQLLSVPPYAAAALFTVFVGTMADRTQRRGYFNIGTSLLAVIGFAMLLGSKSATLSYVGTFLAAMGIYPCVPNTITWVANNTEGVYKRGFVIGLVIGWGNMNGVMSSNVYQARNAPWYRPGHAIIMAYLAIGLFGGSIINLLLLKRENAARLAGKRDHLIEGKTEQELAFIDDKRPDFIYTL